MRNFTTADSATYIELGITRMLAHAPAAAMGPFQFGAAVTTNRTLHERLIELMRLRIAFHNQCRSCMAIRYFSAAATVSEGDVCSLERPAEAENLSPGKSWPSTLASVLPPITCRLTMRTFSA
ncbi:hypothetical protein [Halioglobus sp. HI00S01]|uniref:hypothetical protein n=1 Tax=Halioglobus sp. HI00S01 TaxID=1822214 RepID=UPI000AC56C7F|nr:hypothetical protein [Halioglobus sp. HI00S01]